jgi:hypothetical protein
MALLAQVRTLWCVPRQGMALITAGQLYRYYLRQVVVGDGPRPARMPLAKAQDESGVRRGGGPRTRPLGRVAGTASARHS